MVPDVQGGLAVAFADASVAADAAVAVLVFAVVFVVQELGAEQELDVGLGPDAEQELDAEVLPFDAVELGPCIVVEGHQEQLFAVLLCQLLIIIKK